MWHLLNIYPRHYILLCTQDTLNTSITTKVTNITYFHFKAGNLKNFDGIQLFIAKERESTHGIISFLLGQKKLFVYQMGRLCGGAHDISGIAAPLWLHGWVVGGFLGWVGWVYGGMGGKRSSWFRVIVCLLVSPNC